MYPTNVTGNPQFVSFSIPVNPARVRINQQFKSTRTIPPDVKAAIADITKAACRACRETDWETGSEYVGVAFQFHVNSRKQDVDGPEKRTMDAVAKGCGFDDARVKVVHLERLIVKEGEERIDVSLYRVPADPGERMPDRWRGNDPVWAWEDDGGATSADPCEE